MFLSRSVAWECFLVQAWVTSSSEESWGCHITGYNIIIETNYRCALNIRSEKNWLLDISDVKLSWENPTGKARALEFWSLSVIRAQNDFHELVLGCQENWVSSVGSVISLTLVFSFFFTLCFKHCVDFTAAK